MFDVLLALLLLRALMIAARGRSLPAFAAAALGSAGFAILALAGWHGRLADDLGRVGLAMLVMVGPSALPGPAGGIPLSALVGAHPLLSRLALSLVLGLGFAAAFRHAGRVSPLSDESVRRKEIGLALLAPALLMLVEVMTFALAASVSDPF